MASGGRFESYIARHLNIKGLTDFRLTLFLFYKIVFVPFRALADITRQRKIRHSARNRRLPLIQRQRTRWIWSEPCCHLSASARQVSPVIRDECSSLKKDSSLAYSVSFLITCEELTNARPWLPTITHSIIGTFTSFAACHWMIKLAPTPPSSS